MADRTYELEAYSFEASFSLKEVLSWLPPAPSRGSASLLVVDLGAGATLFVFTFGALVFVAVPRARIDAVLEVFQRSLPHEPHPPFRETFRLHVDATKRAPDVTFDSVTVPDLSPLGLECIATVLAQSVAIDYYEDDLGETLANVRAIAGGIAKTGKLVGPRRALVRFVGTSIASQVEMLHSISLLDKPDFTWEDEAAERLYDVLRHHLEIPERYRALDKKLTTIREALSNFLEVNAARRALQLETTVVILILLEIGLGLYQHFVR